MPFTLRRSTARVNGSLVRWSTIACAFAGPIPGRLASSATEAVLTLILDLAAAHLRPRRRCHHTGAEEHEPAEEPNRRSPESPHANLLVPVAPLRAPHGRDGSQAAYQQNERAFPGVQQRRGLPMQRHPQRFVTAPEATFPFVNACVTRLASRRRALHGV